MELNFNMLQNFFPKQLYPKRIFDTNLTLSSKKKRLSLQKTEKLASNKTTIDKDPDLDFSRASAPIRRESLGVTKKPKKKGHTKKAKLKRLIGTRQNLFED